MRRRKNKRNWGSSKGSQHCVQTMREKPQNKKCRSKKCSAKSQQSKATAQTKITTNLKISERSGKTQSQTQEKE